MKLATTGPQDSIVSASLTQESARPRIDPVETAALQVKETTMDEIASLEDRWKVLERRSTSSFFLTWPWIGAWLGTHPQPKNVKIFEFRAGGALVGLAILGRATGSRFLARNKLLLHESGTAGLDSICIEGNGILCLPGFEGTAMLSLLRHLKAQPRTDDLVFSGITPNLRKFIADHGGGDWELSVDRADLSPYTDLDDIKSCRIDFLSTRSPSVRGRIRRMLRRASPFTVHRAGTCQQALDYLHILRKFHQARWENRGSRGAFAEPLFTSFHQTLIKKSFESGSIELLLISDGERPVGALYNFIYQGVVHAYQSGFDYSSKHLSPGILCHYLAICHYLERGDVSRYDFLAGDSRYKRNLSTSAYPLEWCRLRRKSTSLAVEKAVRRLKNLTSFWGHTPQVAAKNILAANKNASILIGSEYTSLKVLSLIDTRKVSGPAKGLLQLARHLGTFDIVLEIAVITYEDQRSQAFVEECRQAGIKVHTLQQASFSIPSLVSLYRQYSALITRGNFAILQSHGYKTHLLACLGALRFQLPWISVNHGWTSQDYKVCFYQWLERRLLLFSSSAVAVSRSLHTELKNLRRSRPSIYIPNAVDSTTAPDAAEASASCSEHRAGSSFLLAQLNLPSGAFILGVIGRLSPEKGVADAIQALSLLPNSNVFLLIVGDGPLRADLEALAIASGQRDRVRFLPHQHDLAPLYRALDLIVIPSRSEGLPNVLLEACFFGVPVVATNVGDIPSIVIEDHSGYLCLPANSGALAHAIRKALSSDSARHNCAQRAREIVLKDFQAPERAAAFAAVYRAHAGQRNTGRRFSLRHITSGPPSR